MSNGPRVPGGNPADPFPIVNDALDVYAWAEVYAVDPTEAQLLDFRYLGGRWGGFPIADGDVALTDDAENYVVVERATGVLSVATSTTNWNNLDDYARVFHITTADGERDTVRDYRAGPGGVHGQGAGGGGGGGGVPPVVTEAGTALTADDTNAGNYTRFTNAGAKTYTFDSAESYGVGAEYHVRNVGAGDLTLTEDGTFTLHPPAGGTLVVPQGGTATIKIVASDEADVFGVTVPV